MTERVARLDLRIDAGPDADAAELAELAVRLRQQLLELDIERVDPVTAGRAPPGTRAGEVVVAGAMTVMLALSSGLLTALVQRVQSWVAHSRARSVEIEFDGKVLKLESATPAQQAELIKAWIDHHTGRGHHR